MSDCNANKCSRSYNPEFPCLMIIETADEDKKRTEAYVSPRVFGTFADTEGYHLRVTQQVLYYKAGIPAKQPNKHDPTGIQQVMPCNLSFEFRLAYEYDEKNCFVPTDNLNTWEIMLPVRDLKSKDLREQKKDPEIDINSAVRPILGHGHGIPELKFARIMSCAKNDSERMELQNLLAKGYLSYHSFTAYGRQLGRCNTFLIPCTEEAYQDDMTYLGDLRKPNFQDTKTRSTTIYSNPRGRNDNGDILIIDALETCSSARKLENGDSANFIKHIYGTHLGNPRTALQ